MRSYVVSSWALLRLLTRPAVGTCSPSRRHPAWTDGAATIDSRDCPAPKLRWPFQSCPRSPLRFCSARVHRPAPGHSDVRFTRNHCSGFVPGRRGVHHRPYKNPHNLCAHLRCRGALYAIPQNSHGTSTTAGAARCSSEPLVRRCWVASPNATSGSNGNRTISGLARNPHNPT